MQDPKNHLEIKQDGEVREILMSFGLLNEITTLIGDPAQAASVYFQPELRERVILTALHERDKNGKVINEATSLDEAEISVSDIERVLAWEVEHAIAFFARSMERVKGLQGQLESLMSEVSSLNGSQTSPLKTPSSGPSE